MKTAWTNHLKTDEEKKKFAQAVQSSKLVLERLSRIIEEEDKSTEQSLMKSSSYDTPNWDYKAADNNGYRRALRLIKDIINLDQQKVNND